MNRSKAGIEDPTESRRTCQRIAPHHVRHRIPSFRDFVEHYAHAVFVQPNRLRLRAFSIRELTDFVVASGDENWIHSWNSNDAIIDVHTLFT